MVQHDKICKEENGKEEIVALKTNLFKGDRVKLSQPFINARMTTQNGVSRKVRERIGTVTNDTTRSNASAIIVLWDGKTTINHHTDHYQEGDLVLVEEEEHAQ